MSHQAVGTQEWAIASANKQTAEGLQAFIKGVTREIREVALPAYQEANALLKMLGKGPWSDAQREEAHHARRIRAQRQQVLQVLVPAWRLANCQRQALLRKDKPTVALPIFLAGCALRVSPKSLTRVGQRFSYSGVGITAMHAETALHLLHTYAGLFESSIRKGVTSPSLTPSEAKYRLYRKVQSSVVLSADERKLLAQLFNQI